MSTYTVLDPSSEQVLTEVELADLARTDAVIEAAEAAGPAWRAVPPGERARLLRRFATLVEENLEELAQLEVRNSGHTVSNARWEAGNVRDLLNYYSATPERLFGRQIPVPGGLDVTFHEPLGVVGIIVPWNFPMPIAAWGFAPALAAGNTVVLKPAELTPLTALVQSGHLKAVRGRGGGTFVADAPPVVEPPTAEMLAHWRDRRPRGSGGRRGFDRRVGAGEVGQLDLGHDLLGRRVEHGEGAHGHILSKERRSSQSVTAASKAASSTSAMWV